MDSLPALPLDSSVPQVLVWIIGTLTLALLGGIVWAAKYIIIPSRDRHFTYLDAQIECFKNISEYIRNLDERVRLQDVVLKEHTESMRRIEAAIATLVPRQNHR